jgi:hypothetical protein
VAPGGVSVGAGNCFFFFFFFFDDEIDAVTSILEGASPSSGAEGIWASESAGDFARAVAAAVMMPEATAEATPEVTNWAQSSPRLFFQWTHNEKKERAEWSWHSRVNNDESKKQPKQGITGEHVEAKSTVRTLSRLSGKTKTSHSFQCLISACGFR